MGGRKFRTRSVGLAAAPCHLLAPHILAWRRRVQVDGKSLHIVCFIGMADCQMLMVRMCAHTEHIFHQVKALANAMICVCWWVCQGVCYDLLVRVLCVVAESATVLEQQRLIFIKRCCSELVSGTKERNDREWKWKNERLLLRGLNAAVIIYRLCRLFFSEALSLKGFIHSRYLSAMCSSTAFLYAKSLFLVAAEVACLLRTKWDQLFFSVCFFACVSQLHHL